ncbi:hypothetical protein GF376_01250 [Candidatus Peregrinibacteria bacterium]|nr:hypothetical protein [Candidatus Peregrinibacteria bacterium]
MKKYISVLFALTLLFSACATTTEENTVSDDTMSSQNNQSINDQSDINTEVVVGDDDSTVETSVMIEEPIGEMLEVNLDESYIKVKGTKGDGAVVHDIEFPNFNVDIRLDEENPDAYENASLNASIDIPSIESDAAGLTSHLKEADFFDTEQFEKATFASDAITNTEGNNYTIDGILTIKEISVPITLEGEITETDATMMVVLDRLNYELGSENIADQEVPVEVYLKFTE